MLRKKQFWTCSANQYNFWRWRGSVGRGAELVIKRLRNLGSL